MEEKKNENVASINSHGIFHVYLFYIRYVIDSSDKLLLKV